MDTATIDAQWIALIFTLATYVAIRDRRYDQAVTRFIAAVFYGYLWLVPTTAIEVARDVGRYIWALLGGIEVLTYAAQRLFIWIGPKIRAWREKHALS